MTLEEIKAAVLAGRTVHYQTPAYRVVNSNGRWFIFCQSTNSQIGLTWLNGTTLNGKPADFYVADEAKEQENVVL